MPKGNEMEQIRLDGIIGWDVTAGDLRSKLPKNKEDPVNIYINSKGGDPFEGFAIYQALKEYDDVTVEMGGIVASAALISLSLQRTLLQTKRLHGWDTRHGHLLLETQTICKRSAKYFRE